CYFPAPELGTLFAALVTTRAACVSRRSARNGPPATGGRILEFAFRASRRIAYAPVDNDYQSRSAMRDGMKKTGFIGLGAVLGVLLSLNLSVFAQRDARLPIPYEDLQLLS